MKRIGNLYSNFFSFENLLLASRKAIRGSSHSRSAEKFFFHVEGELLKLQDEIQNCTYKPGEYRTFEIHDPKERVISVAPFRDRVVHHALINILEPIYEACFIYDSYATRKNKGVHKAVLRSKQFLKDNFWYFKTDIKKYFDSITHSTLLSIVEKKIKDKKLLTLIDTIVRNGGSEGKGLPIGNLTSQFLANVYLNPFDYFVKEELKCTYYIRYMDDFVLLSNDKDSLKSIKKQIESYLKNHLDLELNEKYTFFNSRENGLPFLGRRVFPGQIRILKDNLKRSLRRIQWKEKLYKNGEITEKSLYESVQSVVSYLKSCHSTHLLKSIF